jgi:hypothetical protein
MRHGGCLNADKILLWILLGASVNAIDEPLFGDSRDIQSSSKIQLLFVDGCCRVEDHDVYAFLEELVIRSTCRRSQLEIWLDLETDTTYPSA